MSLPVGNSIIQYLFGLQERGSADAPAASASTEALEESTRDATREGGSLQPVLPTGAFEDFLSRLKRQQSHASTSLLLSHIRRFTNLDVAAMDEGGPDSAPAVFRRLVAYHAVRATQEAVTPCAPSACIVLLRSES